MLIVTDQVRYAPVGALYLADALVKHGHTVEVRAVTDHPDHTGFDAVCISAHTSPYLKQLSSFARSVPGNKPVIWGGVHATLLPDQINYDGLADTVVCGPGEHVIPRHLDGHDDCVKCTGDQPLDDYSPLWDLVTDDMMESYLYTDKHSVRGLDAGRDRIFYYLVTSRGCTWGRCRFCYESHRDFRYWRGHSLQWFRDQIDYLITRCDIDGIGLWDDDPMGDWGRAVDMFTHLKDKDIAYLCDARAVTATRPGVTKFLADTGCLQLFIGMESGNDTMLKLMGKGETVNTYRRAVEAAKKCGLPVRGSFIYGFPGETDDMARDTIDLINEFKEYDRFSVSGPKTFTPYPGTGFYTDCLTAGWSPPTTTAGWSDIHRKTDITRYPWVQLSKDTISELESLKED